MVCQPRKPDEIKILDGTFRRDRDGDPATVLADTSVPEMPLYLKPEARAFWNQVVPGLIARGVAKSSDTPALAALCEWWQRYRQMSRRIDRLRGKDAGKLPQTMMMMGIAYDKWERMASRFGLTPVDRARVRLAAGDTRKEPKVPVRKRV